MEQEKTKQVILPYVMYVLFSFILLAYAHKNQWQGWAVVTIVYSMAACGVIHLLKGVAKKPKRILFGIATWMNLFLCVAQGDHTTLVLGMMIVSIALLSMFDEMELHYISIFATGILFLTNLILLSNEGWGIAENLSAAIVEYFPVALVELIEFNQLKERIRNEKQLKVTMENLKTAERGKMDFMANVSHEIRTPLNVICGIASALMEENLPGRIKEDIYQLHVSSRHLMTLVTNILDFTELENDSVEIVEEPYHLTSVINDVVNMAETWNEGKNLDIIVDCDARIPNSMIGDGQNVYRILLNLMHNAIKFTSEGGVTLVIKARKEEYGINLAMEVKDTGIGMKEQDVEKLGGVYNQVDTKRDRKQGGVGLGLAISRKMISRMNGFMHITSVYGEGTTVSVVIPQKCTAYEPMVSVERNEDIRIVCYINLAKYKNGRIRDDYLACIDQIAEGLQVSCIRCNHIQELQRRVQNGNFNYVITAIAEYLRDQTYFDSLRDRTSVVVVIDRSEEAGQISPGIKLIKKPFHVFGVAAILNGQPSVLGNTDVISGKQAFSAPEAKVLAVDDVLMNLNVVAALLKHYEITIDIAESGQEALEKVKKTRYDLIFMDHMMPEMDGVETLHHIRGIQENDCRTVPIVALTANAVGGARDMFLREGFQDFVAKPIERSDMERVLKKYLGHRIVTKEMRTAKTESALKARETGETQTDLYGELQKIPGLDAASGRIYCGGDLESYVEILKDFMKSGWQRKQWLDMDLEKEDLASYKIHVHSLKGMAATIGGNQVAELAKEMQSACEAGKWSEVRANHAGIVRQLEELLKNLERILGAMEGSSSESKKREGQTGLASKELAVSGQEKTEEILERLKQAVEMFDQMQTMELIDQLEENSPDEESLIQLAQNLRCHVEQFDFLEAEKLLSRAGGAEHDS